MSLKTPKTWVKGYYTDETGLIVTDEFGPFFQVEITDGVVMPDNDINHCILWFDDTNSHWYGWDSEKRNWGRKYNCVWVTTKEE